MNKDLARFTQVIDCAPTNPAFFEEALARIAAEHKTGRWVHPIYQREEVVSNPELNDAIYEIARANFQAFLYDRQGNKEAAMEEFTKYQNASNKIFHSRKFTKRERSQAYRILD